MKTEKEFRARAKQWLLSIARQRLFLIRTNKSKCLHQDELRSDAEIVRNNLQLLFSDKSIAEFIVRNSTRIYRIIPKRTGSASGVEERRRETLLTNPAESFHFVKTLKILCDDQNNN